MYKAKYYEYIKSLKWSYRREEVIKRIGHCQKCGLDKGLQVHHGSYKELGFELRKHLFVLCVNCHKSFHKKYGVEEDLMQETNLFLKSEIKFSKRYKNKKKIKKLRSKEKFNIAKDNSEKYWEERVSQKYKYF